MIKRFKKLFSKPLPVVIEDESKEGQREQRKALKRPKDKVFTWEQAATSAGDTMDSISYSGSNGDSFNVKSLGHVGINPQQAEWFMSQQPIAYSLSAYIAKHWLVAKAISVPAKDAIRNGYTIDCDDKDAITTLRYKEDEKFDLNARLLEFLVTGRTFGGAVALFLVESTDPDYYENPFNIDGVLPGSYKGIKIIDPVYMNPVLHNGNIQDPASADFMRPTYWEIGNRRYHHTHFTFCIPNKVSDIAKPTYRYFGISLPELIHERVYSAEKTASEAPELVVTKRLSAIEIPDLQDLDPNDIYSQLEDLAVYRDNFSMVVLPEGSNMTQYETSLGDLDSVIMTQYQLVAAAANVPATKLLGTTPKGFNSTGDYEESSYREELESIQTTDLKPLLLRHYNVLSRSLELMVDITLTWDALDSPEASEVATINNLNSQTAVNYHNIGAIDGYDVRDSLNRDEDSPYYGLASKDKEESDWDLDDEDKVI